MQPVEYYQENGYVIFRNLISIDLIDQLLERYSKEIVPSCYPFFRQNTNRYEVNRLNEFGYVEQSFLDIHDYDKFPEFSNIAKEIYCSNSLQDALRQITGSHSFNLMQTMLFDANTETRPHQDWWYLDTVPNGNLIAAWIALEDIDERAGRFYVMPNSIHNPDFHTDTPNLSHSEWLQRIQIYFEANQEDITAPNLQKGDVLFWNSKTIHGALPTRDRCYSRKSLTAHYIPSEYKFGNLFTVKDYIAYQTYKGVNFYRNQPDYSFANAVKYKIKNLAYNSPALLKLMRKLQLGIAKTNYK
ncbi:phytanoyl-CoA dioxygenase family protein [Anabaena sphaerica FACHB-251]|uniref:Phytanoyl-CoA dioxygenase family protein n=1 Tax=Anabaena sphaerica FACHB-251 TaxID=2692883 RepID=A0A927A3T2_9NOST|nr:phytanoyl-CoA dioxygenase family protein [Anabaena sphaerica]MBD2296496.1 phytanoyl-CoA dioxygenase family protein [Anabaena sphaerica FACHB-251]